MTMSHLSWPQEMERECCIHYETEDMRLGRLDITHPLVATLIRAEAQLAGAAGLPLYFVMDE